MFKIKEVVPDTIGKSIMDQVSQLFYKIILGADAEKSPPGMKYLGISLNERVCHIL